MVMNCNTIEFCKKIFLWQKKQIFSQISTLTSSLLPLAVTAPSHNFSLVLATRWTFYILFGNQVNILYFIWQPGEHSIFYLAIRWTFFWQPCEHFIKKRISWQPGEYFGNQVNIFWQSGEHFLATRWTFFWQPGENFIKKRISWQAGEHFIFYILLGNQVNIFLATRYTFYKKRILWQSGEHFMKKDYFYSVLSASGNQAHEV